MAVSPTTNTFRSLTSAEASLATMPSVYASNHGAIGLAWNLQRQNGRFVVPSHGTALVVTGPRQYARAPERGCKPVRLVQCADDPEEV